MKTLTEQNYPLLKYLHWHRKLTDHPDFRRVRNDRSKPLPILQFENIPRYVPDARRKQLEMMNGVLKICEDWEGLAPAFSSKIDIVSHTFFEALIKSYDTFVRKELYEELVGKELSGTIIQSDGDALCYDIIVESVSETPDGELGFKATGTCLHLKDGVVIRTALLEGRCLVEGEGDVAGGGSVTHFHSGLIDFLMVYHLFCMYAEVETKDAVSEGKAWKTQYANTLCPNVRHLDCSWYTTIVRNEDFKVRGHFRLQPCGTGKKERRLIYINEFVKHGYVRKAKLLKEENKE